MSDTPGERALIGEQLDPQAFRRVLAQLPTSLVIVTAIDAGRPLGLAVTSFSSVSLDPPLVMFCPARTSTIWPSMQSAGPLCINVLGQQHEHMARRFARQGMDRFAGIGFDVAPGGAPRLDDAIAWVECTVDQEHLAGDHLIVVARVDSVICQDDDSRPLLFYQGRFQSV